MIRSSVLKHVLIVSFSFLRFEKIINKLKVINEQKGLFLPAARKSCHILLLGSKLVFFDFMG